MILMIRNVFVTTVVALGLGVGCANNVGQNAHTGPDGSPKHPKELVLVNGEVTTKGIVTYPGGDRADWKSVEIPDKGTGTLDIKLTWKVPRPGLQLAFDVYNEYGTPLSKSSASGRKRGGGRLKSETINDATGKILIRVYAVGRGDAGAYVLALSYKENPRPIIFRPEDVAVADPPKLPDIPTIVEPCTNDNFDVKKPECKNFCPDPSSLAPKGWPPCSGPDKCPDPNDLENLACWKDSKTRPKCEQIKPWRKKFVQWCPAPTTCPTPPDPDIPACAPKPQFTRVLQKQIQGSDVIITVGAGKDKGVTPDWSVTLVRAGSNPPAPLQGGAGKIIRVAEKTTVVKVTVTSDTVDANPDVMLTPPK